MTPKRAPSSGDIPVMGKSQIKSLTEISNLLRNGFKLFSLISNPHFSSNPKSFKVKYQIFHKIEVQQNVKIAITDALYFLAESHVRMVTVHTNNNNNNNKQICIAP